jgi:hypothetical protein
MLKPNLNLANPLLGKMLRHYDEIIPHYFDHLENMFLEGGVYVTPPFDLDSQDYLRTIYFIF